MILDHKTAQMRALAQVDEGQPGAYFWATPTRARELIAGGRAALVNAEQPLNFKASGILRRETGWPFVRFSVVAPEWSGRAAVLLGGGPSLTLEQVALVASARAQDALRVIAINDAYLWAPWADVLYAADSQWWKWAATGTAKPGLNLTSDEVSKRFRRFDGERCTIQHSGANVEDAAVHMLRNLHGAGTHGTGLSRDQRCLATGRNSGSQALNLATLAGARIVLLLAFDGRPASNGRTHFHGGHPRPTPVAAYEEYRRAFMAMEDPLKELGVTVWNCSPNTFIDTFPKKDLAAALASLDRMS